MAEKRVLIFGGSFNPPTLAHEEIIRQCLALPGFDEVWAMPSGERLDKHIGTQDAHRLNMLELVKKSAFKDDGRMHISDFELNLPRPTNTFDTLQALRRTHPNIDFWFAFGADSYRDMHNWPHGDELRSTLTVVIFGEQKPPGVEFFIALPKTMNDISSTSVRQMVNASLSASDQLDPTVNTYILGNRLYSANDNPKILVDTT